MGELRVAVLGPIEVERGGTAVRLGPRQVELLSVLLIEVGRPVLATRLVDLLWGGAAPESAQTTLRSHVSHLRRALRAGADDGSGRGPGSVGGTGGVIATVGTGAGLGYRLDLAPEAIDAYRFERGLAEGRDLLARGGPERAARAAELIGGVLALWRGPAFADVADRPFARAELARLDALRRTARRGHAEALSLLGRYAEVIGELTGALAEEPYDEALRGLLAAALYAEQRVDEAADVCRQGLTLLRRRGLDAPELDELLGAILRRAAVPVVLGTVLPGAVPAGPGGPGGTDAEATGADKPAVPSLLPPDPPRFTGRTAEIAQAERLCAEPNRPGVLVVTGPAGVGKTSLAVRLGHALAARFPDGQLYVNLRGFDPGASAMSVDEAVRIFLDALGVPLEQVPGNLDACVGRYRSLLAGRRILVVLDNARDADQVRPLLPGAGGCWAVVTSRHQLPGLVAAEGAQPLTLGLLSAAEARELLARRLGAARVDAEPDPVHTIVERCGRLPLALAVVAARAATHPEFRLAALADELAETRGSLDGFASDDAATDLRSVFSWSYRALDGGPARLFRLFGLHPGPELTVPVAASLAGLPARQVRPMLADLTRVQLLSELAPGRYTCHDLLRAYAAELVAAEPQQARRAAEHRMLDHYLHTAYAADLLLSRLHEPIVLPPPQPGVTLAEPADEAGALEWFNREYPVLIGAVGQAARSGFDPYTWWLASTLTIFLGRRGYWSELATVQRAALAAAERQGDRAALARAHREIAPAWSERGNADLARDHLERALALLGELGDLAGQGFTLLNLGWLGEQRGDRREALRYDERALELFERAGHVSGQARALNAVGWDHTQLGDHRRALDHCERALALQQQAGDRMGEGATWDSIGYAHHQLGEYAQAVRCYRQALRVAREVGHRFNEAEALDHLGTTYLVLGDVEAARTAWRQAVAIFTDMGHVAVDELRARLDELGPG